MKLEQLLQLIRYKSEREWLLAKLENNLSIYTQKNIAIYGTGNHTQLLLRSVNFKNVNVIGLIDQDKEKIGSVYYGYKVFSLDQIVSQTDIIIISSDVYQETIYDRLKYLEYDGKIVLLKIYPDKLDVAEEERIYFHDDDDLGVSAVPYLNDGLATHINRYIWASMAVRDRDVLDIACGCGYGSALLAETAHQVTGVDVNNIAFQYAQKYFIDSNITFSCQNLNDLQLGENYDVITSFETIEHICDEQLYMDKIKQHLKRDGTFFVSTPLAPQDGQSIINQWHVNEYTEQRFLALMQEHFYNVELYLQDIMGNGAIVYRQAKLQSLDAYRYCLLARCQGKK